MSALDWLVLVLFLGTLGLHVASQQQAEQRRARASTRLQSQMDRRAAAEERLAEQVAANERLAEELAEARLVVAEEVLTEAQKKILLENVCAHCGGIHSHACPRVKRLRFRADASIEEVEFWRDGQWDATRVRWIEDLPLPAAPEQ